MMTTTTMTVRREIVVAAEPEEAWRAWTEPERLAGWFCRQASFDAREGGEIRFAWEDGDRAHGTVLEAIRPTRLVFEWWPFGQFPEGAVPADVRTRVEVRIEPHARGSRIVLEESGFDRVPEEWRSRSFADNEWGWDSLLAALVARLNER